MNLTLIRCRILAGIIPLIEIIPACRTLVILIEPRDHTVNMVVVGAWEEEYFAAFFVGVAAYCTYFPFALLLSYFDRKLLHVLVLHSVVVFYLLVLLLV